MSVPETHHGFEGESERNRWFFWILLLLVPAFWVFARYLERIDLTPVIEPIWNQTVPVLPLPKVVVFVVEMLHPRVWRHLVVIFAGWFLAQGAALSMVQVLYDLPDRTHAAEYLRRLRSPNAALGKPVKLNGKTLEEDRAKYVLLRVGGPGMVIISEREAAVTELNGRFHRVLGPGKHVLAHLEYVYVVLDLRQQERVAEDIPLMTKDGIELRADVSITYRIATGGEPPTRAEPYPYSEEAAMLAAYSETILDSDKVADWQDIPLGVTVSALSRLVAKFELDQLLYPHSVTIEPIPTIRKRLEEKVSATLEKSGIALTSLHIRRLELPEPVIEQFIEYWQAHWETQVQLQNADGDAYTLEEVEIARAEAEVTMIRAIVEGMQRAKLEGGGGAMQEVVALRLIEAMEKVAEHSRESFPLPTSLMPQLSDLREQLLESGEDVPLTDNS